MQQIIKKMRVKISLLSKFLHRQKKKKKKQEELINNYKKK